MNKLIAVDLDGTLMAPDNILLYFRPPACHNSYHCSTFFCFV